MRKTIIVLVVALALMSLVGCGNSETSQTSMSIDLSKLSDEEIISLNKKIQEEIVSRNIEKSATLLHGTYYVGTDLPAGSYTVYAKADANDSIIFYVYADDTHRANSESRFHEYVGREEEKTWAVSLNEGEVVTFDSGEITLTVSAGIKFQ